MSIEKNYNQEPSPEKVFESKGQEDILEILTERIDLEKKLLLTAPTMRFAVEYLSDQDVVNIWTQAKQRIETETDLVQLFFE